MGKKKLAGIIAGCLIVVIVIVAPTIPEPLMDYSTLLLYLRDSGASISEEERESDWSFFYYAECRIVKVDNSPIRVYEYVTSKGMELEASAVSPDGFSITKDWGGGKGSHRGVDWISEPHFYKAGRIIVIYIGNNSSITSLLEDALGRQFAGM